LPDITKPNFLEKVKNQSFEKEQAPQPVGNWKSRVIKQENSMQLDTIS